MIVTKSSKSAQHSPKGSIVSPVIVRSKYSNIPVNVPVIYPSFIKAKENTLECFNGQILREMIGRDFSRQRKARHMEIKKNDAQDAIELIIKDTKKIVRCTANNKKKGSMYVSELWGHRHRQDVVKMSQLDKAYESVQKAEAEELKEKLDKLQKAYERRDLHFEATDSNKVLEQFKNKGLNSPQLRSFRTSSLEEIRGRSSNNLVPELKDEEQTNRSKTRPGSLEMSVSTNDLLEKINSPRTRNKLTCLPRLPKLNEDNEHRFDNRRKTFDIIWTSRRSPRTSSLSYLNEQINESDWMKTMKNSQSKASITPQKIKSSRKSTSIFKLDDFNKPLELTSSNSPNTADTKSEKITSIFTFTEKSLPSSTFSRSQKKLRTDLLKTWVQMNHNETKDIL